MFQALHKLFKNKIANRKPKLNISSCSKFEFELINCSGFYLIVIPYNLLNVYILLRKFSVISQTDVPQKFFIIIAVRFNNFYSFEIIWFMVRMYLIINKF